MPEAEVTRPLWQTVLFFSSLVAILVFANWGKPAEAIDGFFAADLLGQVDDHRPGRPGPGRDPGRLVPLAELVGWSLAAAPVPSFWRSFSPASR